MRLQPQVAYAIRSYAAARLLRLLSPIEWVIDGLIAEEVEAGNLRAFTIHPSLVSTVGDFDKFDKRKIPSIIWNSG